MNKTLYKRTSTGKIQVWNVSVTKENTYHHQPVPNMYIAKITYTYGQIDGKKQTKVVQYTSGKNIGRSNETTPYEQAVLDAESDMRKKIKKGYVENIEDIDIVNPIPRPMEAYKYQDHIKRVKTYKHIYMQPKLDGCVAGDTIVEFEPEYANLTLKITIKEIVDKELYGKIRCFNSKTNRTEYMPILNWAKDGNDIDEGNHQWYEIELEDGKILKATGNHLIYLPDIQCYRRVDELIGDEVLLVY